MRALLVAGDRAGDSRRDGLFPVNAGIKTGIGFGQEDHRGSFAIRSTPRRP
jgi:hypothetical protein